MTSTVVGGRCSEGKKRAPEWPAGGESVRKLPHSMDNLRLGLEKFCDSVCLPKLIGLELEGNIPQAAAVDSHASVLQRTCPPCWKMVGQSMHPTNGILPGWLLPGKQIRLGGIVQHS